MSHFGTFGRYLTFSLFEAFDTEQAFSTESSNSINSLLSPFLVFGQLTNKKELLKNAFKTCSNLPFLLGGMLLGSFAVKALSTDPYAPASSTFSCNNAYEKLIGCDIKPHILKEYLTQYRSTLSSEETVADSSAPVDDDDELLTLDGVYISGSVRYDSGQYDYVLNKAGDTFEAWENGFRVYDISACKAMAISLDNKEIRKELTCINGESL